MTRIEWFKAKYMPDVIYEIHEGDRFTEITFRSGGYPLTFRVYGDDVHGFTVTER